MQLTSLRTPAVVIDAARFERNIDRMQAAVDARRLRLRPHAKTHKSPEIARMQIARGAVGVCCAKLGEAEVFAESGIADIRLPYPINPVNADRVVRLARLVGREAVIAGTDCGFAQGPFHRRVHPTIMWAKLEALAAGAQLASEELWH